MEIKLSAFLVKSFLLRGDDGFLKVLVVIASSESRLEFVTDRWCLGRTHKVQQLHTTSEEQSDSKLKK